MPFFQSSGTFPCLRDAVNSRIYASVISEAHSLRNRAGILSGPHALLESMFFNNFSMPFLVKLILVMSDPFGP